MGLFVSTNGIVAATLPSLDLGEQFPDIVHVLHWPELDKFLCYSHWDDETRIEGLGCFASFELAEGVALRMARESQVCHILGVTFDKAREIAKTRPVELKALLLLDDPDSPVIHWIR